MTKVKGILKAIACAQHARQPSRQTMTAEAMMTRRLPRYLGDVSEDHRLREVVRSQSWSGNETVKKTGRGSARFAIPALEV